VKVVRPAERAVQPTNGGVQSARRSGGDVQHLQELVQTFVRSFGLLVAKQTPCGQPVAPSYAHALMLLFDRQERGETSSHHELGKGLGIDKSNIARMCARMEAARHAVQRPAAHDGRSRLVTLTPSGLRLAERIREASMERFRRVLTAIPRDERSKVMASLSTLNSAVGTLGHVESEEET